MNLMSENISINQDVMQLMSIYYNEKNHRDNMYWKQMYYYYIVTFSVAVIPLLTESATKYSINIPMYIFEIIAIITSIFTLYVSFAYIERDKKIEEANQKLMKKIPEEFQIKRIERRVFSLRIKKLFAILIFITEVIIAIAIMYMCR